MEFGQIVYELPRALRRGMDAYQRPLCLKSNHRKRPSLLCAHVSSDQPSTVTVSPPVRLLAGGIIMAHPQTPLRCPTSPFSSRENRVSLQKVPVFVVSMARFLFVLRRPKTEKGRAPKTLFAPSSLPPRDSI